MWIHSWILSPISRTSLFPGIDVFLTKLVCLGYKSPPCWYPCTWASKHDPWLSVCVHENGKLFFVLYFFVLLELVQKFAHIFCYLGQWVRTGSFDTHVGLEYGGEVDAGLLYILVGGVEDVVRILPELHILFGDLGFIFGQIFFESVEEENSS